MVRNNSASFCTKFARKIKAAALCSIIFCATVTYGQVVLNNVSVNEDRPLGYAARSIAQQTESIITFEEMIFENSDDLVQAPVLRRGEIYYMAKYGEFNFEYDPDRPLKEILDALLGKYHSEYPGRYKIVEGDRIFHIVPDSSKDIAGNYVARTSLLETKVSLNLSNVSARDIVCQVVQQVSMSNDVDLGCFTELARLDARKFDNYSADDVVARDVLSDVLIKSGGNVSWFLWRDITTNRFAITFMYQP